MHQDGARQEEDHVTLKVVCKEATLAKCALDGRWGHNRIHSNLGLTVVHHVSRIFATVVRVALRRRASDPLTSQPSVQPPPHAINPRPYQSGKQVKKGGKQQYAHNDRWPNSTNLMTSSCCTGFIQRFPRVRDIRERD